LCARRRVRQQANKAERREFENRKVFFPDIRKYQIFKFKEMDKLIKRQKIRYRIRKKIAGSADKPRLSVFRSNSEIYAQLINDATGTTIVAASSRDKDIVAQKVTKTEKSKLVGLTIARKATELGIQKVVFDRGGNLYHGRVKAIAEAAREGGLQF
jgi:large subunit ribosomal protein L18